MKLLLLDIETAPSLAYVWGLFRENIPLQRLVDAGFVMCWAAKWLGEDEIMFGSFVQGQKKMLKRIHKLLEQADVVVHYNGAKFDIPTLNKEFLLSGFPPPAGFQQIDLLKIVRKQFRFQSNKLDHVTRQLGLGQKSSTDFNLWMRCMEKDQAAWEIMEEYNKQDVRLLEAAYNRLLPWIHNHPNHGLYSDAMVCPNCSSDNLVRRGYAYTSAGKYQRYQCSDCGAWSKDRKGVQEQTLGGII